MRRQRRLPSLLLGNFSRMDAILAWDAAEGYDVTAVPSMRMVVDLADLDRSRWIQLSGSSGHAFHEHYVDQLPLWAAGRTPPWAFDDEVVTMSTEDTLTLRPTAE